MTKGLVEIDDADLEAARAALATSTVEKTGPWPCGMSLRQGPVGARRTGSPTAPRR